MRAILRVAALVALATLPARAADPGVTPTSLKIGQTVPLSGPVSVYATFSRASLAFYEMINEGGGINGRKIELLSVDDAFSPPKTVEQTRKLVEADGVFAIVAPMGSAAAIAVQKYLNKAEVPQFLIQSGLSRFNNPTDFPWTVPGLPNYTLEVGIYAKYIRKATPNARVAVLYQNDDYGRSYLAAMKSGLEGSGATIVGAEGFDLTEPTVDSQIVKLAASGADTLLVAATAKQTVQTLKKSAELAWRPQMFVAYPAASVERTYAVAGTDIAKGAITTSVFKDPGDPSASGDPEVQSYLAWMGRFYPRGDRLDTLNVAAYVEGQIFTEVLRRCGPDVSRKNFLKQATSLGNYKAPMLRDAVIVRTEPNDYDVFRSMQLLQFDGVRNRPIEMPAS